MNPARPQPTTVDEYIAAFPPDVRDRLASLRRTVKAAAPGASEKISYGIPTFWLNGNLVHFAAFTNHVGFYPGPEAIAAFGEALRSYRTSKGAIRLPHDRPLPLALVDAMVRFCVDGRQAPPGKGLEWRRP